MAYIEKRRNSKGELSYRVQVKMKGNPRESATFTRLTDAKKWIQQTETAIREGRHFKTSEAKKHTLAELIDRYIANELPKKPKSIRDQTRQLNWWKSCIGEHLLSDIKPPLIVEYRDILASGETHGGARRAAGTVNRYIAALSHAFTIAVNDWGWVEDNPLKKISKLKEPRGRVRYLSDDERERLLETCKSSNNPYLYPVVVLALSTGMRLGEIMRLTWRDVDLQRGFVLILESKNDERRKVPLVGLAQQVITEHRKAPRIDTPLLFPGKNPKKPIILRSAWETALGVAKITDFRFHDLRHSAASYLAMNGASLAEISEVLGHKTLQMVKRYSHLSDAHTASVVSKMNEKIFG